MTPVAMSSDAASAILSRAAASALIKLKPLAARAVKFALLKAPKPVDRPKRIHPRRLPRRVIEGEESEFFSTSAPLALVDQRELPAGRRTAARDELVVVRDTELTEAARNSAASNVGEPSVAINGNVVLYTGNWYAAISKNGGASFKFMDPTAFDDAQFKFCCDQVVHYIPSIDTFVWLLQYGPDTGDNIQRLAFAKTADAVAARWRFFDITTSMLGVPRAFIDFPDLATGANALYVTTNIFLGNGGGAAVIRIPFAGIASGQIAAQRFISPKFGMRVAQNCGSTAYFATTDETTSALRVFSWPESAAQPTSQVVPVTRWIGGNSGYQSRTPDARRWLDRADPRITGATLAGNHLWFAWSVDRGSNQRPKPFIQIAKIRIFDMTNMENINVFDNDSAMAYPALSTNSNDEVGISYMIGGGPRFPSHVVGMLTGTVRNRTIAASDRGPAFSEGKGEWGDYLTVRRVFPNEKLFAATGFTLKGRERGRNQDATPRFVIFGRSADV